MSEMVIPEDLKPLCSKFLAPLDVGGPVSSVEFWYLIERIARAEAKVAALEAVNHRLMQWMISNGLGSSLAALLDKCAQQPRPQDKEQG